MRSWGTWTRRIASLFRRRRLNDELNAEVGFHLDMLTRDNVAAGMEAEEARRAALRSLGGGGGVERMKESYRAQRGVPALESLSQDLRYAVRMLRKSPGFTAVALLSLAFGIGTNCAIFSVVDALLLKSLPVAGAEQLVILQHSAATDTEPHELFTYRAFEQLRQASDVVAGVFALTRQFTSVVKPLGGPDLAAQPGGASSDGETTEKATTQLVSGNFFSVLGASAAVGRTFAADEDVPPQMHPVAVLGDGYWRRRFAADPRVVGSTVSVNGAPVTVVGVMPKSFFGVLVDVSPDIYLPLSLRQAVHFNGNTDTNGPEHPELPVWQRPHTQWLELMARRRPGVSPQRATAVLDVLFHREVMAALADVHDADDRREEQSRHVILSPGGRGLSNLRHRITQPLYILMGVAALVLLIACANIANLLLARADRRRKEMAVRLGIGAARGRLVRQLLTESLLLSGLGAILGLLFAFWGSRFLFTLLARGDVPVQLDAALDLRRLGFAAAAALATGVFFGLAPALQATRVDLSATLKDAARSVGEAGRSHGKGFRLPLGRLLVVLQIGLSLVLLVGAGLFVRSLRNLMSVDPGFDREALFQVQINPRLLTLGDGRLLDLYNRLEDRLSALPGVRSVTISLDAMLGTHVRAESFSVPGYDPHRLNSNELVTHVSLATPTYFSTVGVPLLRGRAFTRFDRAGAPKVAIVNETLARRFFPHGPVVGQHLGFGDPVHARDFEIVGVARDFKYNDLRETAPFMVYRPVAQEIENLEYIEVRTTPQAAAAVASRLRRTIAEVEPALAVFDITATDQEVARSLVREQAIARLTGFFGILALLLAAIGLYGVMSYGVARRTNEIGLRMALGAPRSNVLSLVLRDTLRLIALGLAAGLLASLAATRLATSQLYGLSASDPLTFVVATTAMALVALVAGYLPARRAADTDPMTALRHE
jgi:predicted permease